MPPTAGSSTADVARFEFDLAWPECWLVAERVLQVMPVATEWVPVHVARTAPVDREAIEARAAELELQAVRWPAAVPFDSAFAMRAATFAKGTGRTVAFGLAAFRQAYCGGRDLEQVDSVLIAAAACELHPQSVLKGAALKGTAAKLEAASAGVIALPAVVAPDGTRFTGEDAPERAAAALAVAR